MIFAILAAILVPALLGYIDRAKNQQYIQEARELMTAAQAGIVEGYAYDDVAFINTINRSTYKAVGESYTFITSGLLADCQGTYTQETHASVKDLIAKRLLEYVESEQGSTPQYKFVKLDNNYDVSNLRNNQCAFLILYNGRGKILFM